MPRTSVFCKLLLTLCFACTNVYAYGPFNHLCVVDRNWDGIYHEIQAVGPLPERQAVDAVFAGAIFDDLGYYHLGNPAFKDLTNQAHYIRTGEWADFLLRQAHNAPAPNAALDYAFALGVLSHYAVDRMGHYYGTNAVAVALARRQLIFGPRMSYERDPTIHTEVEAGFDVLSLETSCRANQLSERFYGFLREPGWSQAEQVFGFLVSSFGQFFRHSPLDRTRDLVHAVMLARKYALRLLQEEGGPNALQRISSAKPISTPAKPDFYAAATPAEIAEDDKWIGEQVQTGKKFRDIEKSDGFLPVFAESFTNAQKLLAEVLQSAAELRTLQDRERASGANVQLDDRTFANINLDTNEFSISGRYDLADCTAANLIDKANAATGAKISYPAKTGELAPYFAIGERIRADVDLAPPTGAKALHAQLQKVVQILVSEEQLTHNALHVDAAWGGVNMVHVPFPASTTCPAAAVPFGSERNVCIGPKVVYWHGNVRGITMLFAASAAAHFTTAKGSMRAMDEAVTQNREAVELFRLCDTNKNHGYLEAKSCKNGEPVPPHAIPSNACVNQE